MYLRCIGERDVHDQKTIQIQSQLWRGMETNQMRLILQDCRIDSCMDCPGHPFTNRERKKSSEGNKVMPGLFLAIHGMKGVLASAPGEDAAGEVVEQRTLLSVAPMLDCTNRHFR